MNLPPELFNIVFESLSTGDLSQLAQTCGGSLHACNKLALEKLKRASLSREGIRAIERNPLRWLDVVTEAKPLIIEIGPAGYYKSGQGSLCYAVAAGYQSIKLPKLRCESIPVPRKSPICIADEAAVFFDADTQGEEIRLPDGQFIFHRCWKANGSLSDFVRAHPVVCYGAYRQSLRDGHGDWRIEPAWIIDIYYDDCFPAFHTVCLDFQRSSLNKDIVFEVINDNLYCVMVDHSLPDDELPDDELPDDELIDGHSLEYRIVRIPLLHSSLRKIENLGTIPCGKTAVLQHTRTLSLAKSEAPGVILITETRTERDAGSPVWKGVCLNTTFNVETKEHETQKIEIGPHRAGLVCRGYCASSNSILELVQESGDVNLYVHTNQITQCRRIGSDLGGKVMEWDFYEGVIMFSIMLRDCHYLIVLSFKPIVWEMVRSNQRAVSI